MKRLTMIAAMTMAASIYQSGLRGFELQQALREVNYSSRGKGGERPVRPSGVAKSKRAALKSRNIARAKKAA